MDSQSAKLANLLVNNPEDLPLIEITQQGPTLQFNCAANISLVGADISPMVNSQPIEMNKQLFIKDGDCLSFGKLNSGCRCYLAIQGGIDAEKVMGSYSFYPEILNQNKLKVGSILTIKMQSKNDFSFAKIKIERNHFFETTIEVTKGPEFNLLSKIDKKLIFKKDFTVSHLNNRMGYQVEGPVILLEKKIEMITAITIPGTVQLTPAGNPIVLMRDCQTTGGYPRILQLTENGINRLAQKKAGDLIRFQLM